jgi:hypothetical protein
MDFTWIYLLSTKLEKDGDTYSKMAIFTRELELVKISKENSRI